MENTTPEAEPAPPALAPSAHPELHPIEAAARQRAILLRIVRAGFFVLIVTVAILYSAQTTHETQITWWVPVAIAAVFVVVALLVDLSTPNKKISTISGVFLGVLGGMLATLALGVVMDLLLQVWMDPASYLVLAKFFLLLKVLVGITLCYLGITTVLQTQDDFRLVIPYVEFAKQIRGPKPLVLDTSALIDARIADLCQTGMIQTPVLVPRFVVGELQLLADSHERMKRAKGRRGLDVIARLQRLPALDLSLDETLVPGKAVDQMLIELARRLPGTIVTTDTGLGRVATIQGVSILNLNDVANALRPALIPGESLSIRLLKPGEQPGQGVGYLDDGTMVVAEDGGPRVGQQVTLVVTSSLQTSAGRLIFGRLGGDSALTGDGSRPDPTRNPQVRTDAPRSEPDSERPHGSGVAAAPAPFVVPAASPPASPDDPERRGPFPPQPPRRPNPARNPRR
ncbi:MAG: PIN/TRAM domain-containing protein [Phycisphaerales bacterium]